MPDEHARLSPSSSDRWISCPASVKESEKLVQVEQEESVYATEGTNAHTLGELRARREFGNMSEEDYRAGLAKWEKAVPEAADQAEMEEHIAGYVEYIRSRLTPDAAYFAEQRMPTGVPESFGTSDSVIVTPDTVEIIDLKYGAGVPVSAVKNSQLRLYALGALDTYGNLLGTTTHVTMTVYQPRLNNVSSETLTVDALLLWREEVAIPAAKEALYSRKPRFGPSESACRWCPLAGMCRERMEWATQRDFGDVVGEQDPPAPQEPSTLTPEEISRALPRLKSITSWAKDVEATALEMAYARGIPIPGYKVVRSGGQRKITDDTAAIQRLIDLGFQAEQVAKPLQVETIGKLEKLLGKKEFTAILNDLVTKSQGRESLAPESDKREAITSTSDAAADFSQAG